MNAATDAGYRAFRDVDFNYTVKLQDVWTSTVGDVPEIHSAARRILTEEADALNQQTSPGSPLGWFLTGSGGTGKTHTLNAVQDDLIAKGFGFVLVDMTDVRDFWETVAEGYITSLQNIHADGRRQYSFLIERFMALISPPAEAMRNVGKLARLPVERLTENMKLVLKELSNRYRAETLKYQDAVRSLICLNSENFEIQSLGSSWLRGVDIDEALGRALGFQMRIQPPMEIVRSLSWVMSLTGPTLLAFEQLDPIVHQVARQTTVENATEQNTARWIIDQIGNGLAALHNTTTRTLVVVSCVEPTYHILKSEALGSNLERFHEPPIVLSRQTSKELETLIRRRIEPAYAKHEFVPPYPTWPFSVEAFRGLQLETPREILKACERHRRTCIREGTVLELKSFTESGAGDTRVIPTGELERLDRQFAEHKARADINALTSEGNEDAALASLYQTAFQCLVSQVSPLPAGIDHQIDREFGGSKTNRPMHARLRIIMHNDNEREEHYCVRAIQKSNAAAFKTRLKAAITTAGIDRNLTFRRLVVVRTISLPGGKETEKLIKEFRDKGGMFHMPSGDELRTLFALGELRAAGDSKLEDWIKARTPLDGLGLAKVLAAGSLLEPSGTTTNVAPDVVLPPPASDITPDPSSRSKGTLGATATSILPIGYRMLGPDRLGDASGPTVAALAKHTVILAGAGSGKTVLLYRLVEEAALLGIPSVVVDCANDLSSFDEAKTSSEFWKDGDAARAQRFRAATEMILWTPGKQSGNPLTLQPLPDFTAVRSDADELEGALLMAYASLSETVASGKSAKAVKKTGILKSSLAFFARNYDHGTLSDYAEMLKDLPDGAGPGVSEERKLAVEMADALKVQMTTNPLLNTSGATLDPAVLFGDDRPRAKTRISVINLPLGLPELPMQRTFLNQLAMILFSWIKKNPNPPGRAIRGLLVIDEAKDFVPSQKASECRESLLRLGAQARKYGLGLVFATQHPKDIDHKLVGNSSTHLYGLNNSPASLATLREQMQMKGGNGDDIARLKVGQFYFHSAGATQSPPVKLKIPDCLSNKRLLEEQEILAKARKSRKLVEENGMS